MPNIKRRQALTLPALMLLTGGLLAGCETTKATPTPSAPAGGDMSPADLDFVTNAFNIIEFDRQECNIAQTQARSPEVRALAAQMLQQANDFDAKLRPIAAAAGVTPPTVLRTDLRIRAGRLRLGQGMDFDRSFVEDQIFSHEDTLNMQEMIMNTAGANPQLQDLSKQGNAILHDNLTKLRALQRKMMMMRGH